MYDGSLANTAFGYLYIYEKLNIYIIIKNWKRKTLKYLQYSHILPMDTLYA